MRLVGGVEDADGVDDAWPSKCPLCADGSIGSVRGLLQPQTTIDAPSVDDSSVGSDESSGANHE